MGPTSIRVRAGTVAVAALLVFAPASAALALVTGAPTAVTHHMTSGQADEVRSSSDATVDGLSSRGVRHSWAGNGTDGRRTGDDSDGVAGQDESGGDGSGGEDGSNQDEPGGNGPGGPGPPGQAGSGDGDTGSTTTTSTTTTTTTTPTSATTAPPVTSTTAPASPAGATDDASDLGADEDSEPAERTSTPAGGATSPTTTTTPPTDLRSTQAAEERSSPGTSTAGGRIDVSEPDPALAAALAWEESWSFLAGQGVSPPARPDLVEALDPAPNPSQVVLSWLVERDSTGASMAVLSPIVVLLTVWDAVASAGSGLAAPASALGTLVMLILFEKGHVADAGARLLGRRTER